MDLAVVGAGTMGAGIAQVAVAHGLDVALYDAVPAALERGAARVANEFARRSNLLYRNRVASIGTRRYFAFALP